MVADGRCGVKFCRRRGCRTRLVERIDPIGRVAFGCPACARNKEGRCRDCPGRLENPRSIRCARCALARKRQLDNDHHRRTYPQRREKELAWKRRHSKKPEHRARRRDYERRYRAAHHGKRDDLDRLYFREWARRRRQDPAYRARINARRRERARQLGAA